MAAAKVAVLAIMSGSSTATEPMFLRDLKSTEGDADAHMHQFVLHASLDMVREKQFFTPSMYLGAVETFRDNVVSAWVMANGTSILLLNRGFPEASIKAFLRAVYQLTLLYFLNPLGQRDVPIKTVAFEAKVFQAAAQHLKM